MTLETFSSIISFNSATYFRKQYRGAFGDAAISDLYPKLLKRLDDSSDIIRIAIAHTLEMFLQAGGASSSGGSNRSCYSSTMIDYTLDQLFIHLDDHNPIIQVSG